MLPNKIKPLALLIASALFPLSAQVSAQPLTQLSAPSQISMQQAADQTFSTINHMKQLAESGEGVNEENGERYLNHNGHRFGLHENNYPKFMVPLLSTEEARASFYDIFPFLDNKWDIIPNNDFGFYFIHNELGSFVDDSNGCFIEYLPTPGFSADKILKFQDNACLSVPNSSSAYVSSVFDQGATLSWEGHEVGNQYYISLTTAGDETATTFTATEPEFYLPSLKAGTNYQVAIKSCNSAGCVDLTPINFTTEGAKVGFHDGIRELNHLEGELSAHVSLMQTHSRTAPFGNDELGAPDVVMHRDALMLLTPQSIDTNQIWVEVYQDGEFLARRAMQAPSAQAKTDQYAHQDRPTVIFAHNVWSLPLQWDWMKPGLSLKFIDNHGRESELSSQNIVFGGAPELIIQNIDMGMLTKPRDLNNMAKNTAAHATDYFQKAALSKLVVGQYAPAHFEKITMPNGNVYTERSLDNGGWHKGDMREDIGKALISTGINYANNAISSSAGSSQAPIRNIHHITAHTNVGMYTHKTNGTSERVVHGGSGGGGILTLEYTTGNEWSHEIGHNFSLGHWPSMASVHDMESGWGWDAVYQRFIGNIDWTGAPATVSEGGEVSPPYLDTFRFLRDAQNGGEEQKIGMVSNYTFEHPAQARKAQRWINANSNNQQLGSSPYYVKWDQEQQRYIDAQVEIPVPTQTGVPVTTLVGIYDPTRVNPSQIYPVLYGNYGNVFDLPEADFFEPLDEGHIAPGWNAYRDLSEEQLASDSWKTIVDNRSHKRLCQFSFTNSASQTVNLVGHVEDDTNTCESSNDMKWIVNGHQEKLKSAAGDYSLLYPYGLGEVTYTPTPEIGEVQLCALTKIGEPTHNGAGYVEGGNCRQIPGIKHTNNKSWTYSIGRSGAEKVLYIHNNVCHLEVINDLGETNTYALSGERFNSAQSNKFHINLPQQELNSVSIKCEDNSGEYLLDTLTPSADTGIDELPEAVIIGQEYGYSAVELRPEFTQGWFDHFDGMEYDKLSAREKSIITKMKVYDEKYPVCRFDMVIDGHKQTVFGYVDKLVTGDHRCIGGDDIYVLNEGEQHSLTSELNKFQWLSQARASHLGQKVLAREGYPEKLCSVTRSDFYGAGYVNDNGQCTQVQGIKWSNDVHWAFSSGHGQYTYF